MIYTCNKLNLVTIDLAKYNGRFQQLLEDIYVISRANYRQTCVDLRDGMLQASWHELNEFLRLCGVNVTGCVAWEYDGFPLYAQKLREAAVKGCNSMADELGLPRSQMVTTIQPSGTLSKVMDTTSGIHKPQSRYIFNHVKYSKYDPMVAQCQKAGYRVYECPGSDDAMLVVFPVEHPDCGLSERIVSNTDDDGLVTVSTYYVNDETAIDQLRRYKFWMENYVQHNASITVSYSPDEVNGIIDWIYDNWDSYVGVSFLLRQDPMMTAADLGHPYLPLESVSKEEYDTYVSQLTHVKLIGSLEEPIDDPCPTGQCPIR